MHFEPESESAVVRAMKALGVTGPSALAAALDVSTNTAKSWIQRGSMPIEWLVRAAGLANCSVDSLLGRVRSAPDNATFIRNKNDGSAHLPAPSLTPSGGPSGAGLPVPQSGAFPLTGDAAGALTGGLLAPAATSLTRPLVLPVVWDNGRATRHFEVIPQFNAAAHAGARGSGGAVAGLAADMAGVMALDRAFMRQALGRDGGGFMTVSVSGDSMEPTLADGDTIVVDALVDRVDANGTYVVRVGVDLLVKRIQRKLDGTLVLMSDNRAYKAEQLAGDAARGLKVIGRMVWPRVR